MPPSEHGYALIAHKSQKKRREKKKQEEKKKKNSDPKNEGLGMYVVVCERNDQEK